MADKNKILLIDDEKDFCFFTGKNLEQTGEFEVMTAARGKEGIDLAREKKPDLILLDINMPSVSGPEVAEILFNDPKTKGIPVIFLTAVVTKKEIGIKSISEIGGRNFIAKPVDTETLSSCIKDVLRKNKVKSG